MADISSDPATAMPALVRGYKARGAQRLLLILAAVAALCLLVVADVMTGPESLSFTQVVTVFLNPADATVQQKVTIWNLRLPVALMLYALAQCLALRAQGYRRS